jgi:hypothetical protein
MSRLGFGHQPTANQNVELVLRLNLLESIREQVKPPGWVTRRHRSENLRRTRKIQQRLQRVVVQNQGNLAKVAHTPPEKSSRPGMRRLELAACEELGDLLDVRHKRT